MKCNFRKEEFLKYIKCFRRENIKKKKKNLAGHKRAGRSNPDKRNYKKTAIKKAVEDLLGSEAEVRISSEYFLQLQLLFLLSV